MKIKKTIAMIMALAFVGTAFMANGGSFAKPSVTAYAAEEELEFEGEVLVDGIDYDVKSDHVVLLDCQDSVKGEVIIPETIKGRPVTVIRENAFESCSSLEKIELPKSVKEIGDSAFLWCTSLKEVVIPDGVEKIGESLFYEDTALEKVTIPYIGTSPDDNTTDLDHLFFGHLQGYQMLDPETKEVVYDRNTDEKYLKSEEGIFIPKSFTTLIVTNTEKIPDNAFYGIVSLKSVTLPDNVKSIGGSAFGDCESLVDIHIPDTVTEIGGNAFIKCKSLKTINIPAGLTKLSYGIFGACESLDIKDFKIPDKITYIGDSAFSGCKSMNFGSLVIPESVTYIGSRAFKGCDGLTEISFPSSFGKYDRTEGICFDCANLKKISCPLSNITDLLHFQETLFMSDTLKDEERFYKVAGYIPKALEEIVITDGTEIPDRLFQDFTSLKKVTLPDTITSIGDYSFMECTSLEEINLPESLKSIGMQAFYKCNSLKIDKLTLPETLEVGDFAFFNCDGIKSLDIGDSYLRFASAAIGCANLEEISFGITEKDIEENLQLKDAVFNKRFNMNAESDERYYHIDSDDTYGAYVPKTFERVIISGGEKIYSKLLAGITSIKEIQIADSIKEIDKEAFADCKDAVIIGNTGSYAEKFAKENGMQFKILEAKSAEFILGDVNNDKIIDARDASAVLIEYAQSSTDAGGSFTDEQKKAADVNNDGKVDARDASDILRFYALSSANQIKTLDELYK